MDDQLPGPYRTALAHLDRRIAREIDRLRTRYQLSLDEFRGLYVSDEHVDALIAAAAPAATGPPEGIDSRALAASLEDDPRWSSVVSTFSLSAMAQELLLLALAPEFDLRYETLFAYLNDDVTRKWPTADLARRLLSPQASRLDILDALGPASVLRRANLIAIIDPPAGRPSSLNAGLAVHASLSRFLQHVPLSPNDAEADGDSQDAASLPACVRDEVEALGRALAEKPDWPVVILDGPDAVVQQCAARLLARSAGRPLRFVDLPTLRRSPASSAAFSTLALEARLDGAIVCFRGLHAVFDGDGRLVPDSRDVFAELVAVPLVLTASAGLPAVGLIGQRRVRVVSIATPAYGERVQLWAGACGNEHLLASDADRRALADRYVFTATEIAHAAAAARETRRFTVDGVPDVQLVREAARAIARQRGGQRGTDRGATFGWPDLVLPAHTMSRLTELAAAIRLRHVVFDEWAFGRRSGAGTGVKAMFAGPSGTGKTMAAGVIARELGFDLVKIDLAATVSKYIGETEKNLDRIFSGARAGGSLLFFDEADAIFGKRSEVKDAHDRYANIEVAYLLQKLEEHDGAVILATNLRRNIDEAFSRRLHYVVDFPQPDATLRERLWRGMFPPEAPLASEVDFPFLARQFELSGGDIRNIALDAAFLSAQAAQPIGMRAIVWALARQLGKQGKVPTSTEFRQYQRFLPGATGAADAP